MRKNSFPLTRQGLKDCENYTDHLGIAKEFIENHPEILPAALLIAVGISALLINPLASTVAFKSSIYDSGIVAFKYVDLTNDTQEIEKDIVTEKELENIMACDVVGIINLIDCMEV